MKKWYFYLAVIFAVAVVTLGLCMDLDQTYSMGGREKILIYATPIIVLFIEMACRMKRTQDTEEKKRIQKRSFAYMFAVYLIAAATLLFLGSSFRRTFADRNIWQVQPFTKKHFEMYCNLIPFKTIRMYLHAYTSHTISRRLIVANILGNLAAFMPCAIFLPVLFPQKMTKLRYFIPAVAGIVIFAETVQFFTMVGQADIDDVILNVLGACLLYALRPGIRFLEEKMGENYLT